MTLSNSTFHNLSAALKPEVIDYIHQDQRYVEFLHEVIPDAIRSKLGPIDEEVLFELSCCVMDSICLR